jgi:hypothetical protein
LFQGWIFSLTLHFKVLCKMTKLDYQERARRGKEDGTGRDLRRIRRRIIFFIVALVLSGITAFALETEMSWLEEVWPFSRAGDLYGWVDRVYLALRDSNSRFPFLAYGYDWLAFAHLVIAVAFVGPLRDPVRNKWVIVFGMIACLMVFPLAFIAGAVRGIPIFWRLIDCSFGVVGLVPLALCYRIIVKLEESDDRR